MAPATGPALIILVAFLLPGFVTVLIQERTYRFAEDQTPLDRLLRILYYSVWSYLLLALVALVFHIHRESIRHLYNRYKDNPAELVWRGALAVLVPPFVIATATRLWTGSRAQSGLLQFARVNERHQEPTAWDHFFRQRRGAYVRVTLTNGGRVYGYYGSQSFAAYAKDGRDLFLERVYAERENWFGPEVAGSCGVWIKAEDALCLEFYTPDDAATEKPENGGSRPAAEAD